MADMNTAMMDSKVLLDQKALDNIRGLQRPGGPNPLVKYIDLFLQHSPVLMSTLKAAISAGDIENSIRPAHSLKSDSANLGATSLSMYCKQLEEMCRLGTQTGALELFMEIEAEYQQVCARLIIERDKAA